MIGITLLLIVCGLVLFKHSLILRKHSWMSQFGGPKLNLPIIGNCLMLATHRSKFGELLRSNFKSHGCTFRFWLLHKPMLVTSDPEVIQHLLSSGKHLKKHFGYDHSVKIIFGKNGLMGSDVHQWKLDRKIWNKVFNISYFESGFQKSLNYWEQLEKDILFHNGNPVDVNKYFKRHFLTIFLQSFDLGKNFPSLELISFFEELAEIAQEILNKRIMKPWMSVPFYWRISGNEEKEKNMRQLRTTILQGIINKFEETKQPKLNKAENHTKNTTIQDIINQPENSLEWKYDHLISMIAAGTDTTAITCTMTLFFLALNAECLKRVQEEVDKLFLDKKKPNFMDLSELRYLKMCIKEALRLHPPVPGLGRTTEQEILLKDGRKIPKGTPVTVVISEMHLNPDFFPSPHEFIPERFSLENTAQRPPFTFIPFSTGPRNCIGQKYAEIVIPPILAMVLKNFHIRTEQKAEDIKILYEIAGTPYPHVQLIFEAR